MKLLAIIDAQASRAPQGPATIVAGLSLLERTIRLAHVCGAHRIILRHDGSDPLAKSLLASPPLGANLEDSHQATLEEPTRILYLRADVVFERAFIKNTLNNEAISSPWRHRDNYFALFPGASNKDLQALLQDPERALKETLPRITGGWAVLVDSPEAAKTAARRLWNGCRKPEDGIVSRHLNRHLSIATSKLLAPTFIKPNHVTTLTLTLGVVSAVAAAIGGYAGFLAAGILYQLNSIIDGIDGELARVRYEFSVTGEWLDTISDDLADLLIYIGIGIGAARTMPDAPGPFGPELWLVLGLTAAAGKLASMVVYYCWLIAHKRGDLLAFQWSFKDDEKPETGLSRALSVLYLFFRKDFIVFAAMLLAIGGYFPHLLFALAPGNVIVAISVLLQGRSTRGD